MLGAVSPESFDTLHSYSNTFQMPFVTPWFPEKVSHVSKCSITIIIPPSRVSVFNRSSGSFHKRIDRWKRKWQKNHQTEKRWSEKWHTHTHTQCHTGRRTGPGSKEWVNECERKKKGNEYEINQGCETCIRSLRIAFTSWWTLSYPFLGLWLCLQKLAKKKEKERTLHQWKRLRNKRRE